MTDEKRLKYITHAILYIVSLEDPKYPRVNHYLLLEDIIRRHYRRKGETISDKDIFYRIHSAAQELASGFIHDDTDFYHFYSSQMFECLEPIVSRGLQ